MDNVDLLISRFLGGKSSAAEREDVLKWINKCPENRKSFFLTKEIWEASSICSSEIISEETKQWQTLAWRIDGLLQKEKIIRRRILVKQFFRIASIVLIALITGWSGHSLYLRIKSKTTNVGYEMVIASKGQVKEIFLADGTHVWLNSDSQLKFPTEFTSKNREITLEGEAYFEVKKNEKSPFIVTTRTHKVKVLGTKFNICEYPEDKIIETTLSEGKVKVLAGDKIVDLLPGMQSRINTETLDVRVGQADLDVHTAWIDGRYEFRDKPLEKILSIVERWYDVKVVYPAEMKQMCFSGVIKRHKPVNHLLDVISALQPIEYSISDSEIILKKIR